MDKEENTQTTKFKKTERKLVIPGETIVSGDDYLPGDFTRKEGKDVIANRYGLAEIGKVIKIIPVSGYIVMIFQKGNGFKKGKSINVPMIRY